MKTRTDNKVMVTGDRQENIYEDGARLQEVNSFKHLKATFSMDSSSTTAILIRITTATAGLDKVCVCESVFV